jgi:cellulose biosynthesis protein BcsQ
MSESISVAVIGGKGGVTKSTTSLNVARALDAYIITNDQMSKLPMLCDDENEVSVVEDIQFIEVDDNVVYDFAGYVDGRMVDIVKRVDVVIYVTTFEKLAYSQMGEYIIDLLPYNKNAFIVANKLGLMPKSKESKRDAIKRELTLIKKEVGEQFGLEVFPIKASKKIHEAFEDGLSLTEAVEGYSFKGAWSEELTQIKNIIKRIVNGKRKNN